MTSEEPSSVAGSEPVASATRISRIAQLSPRDWHSILSAADADR